jgi:hypothetical protein
MNSWGARFGSAGESYVHPLVACAMVLVALLVFFLPRRKVIVPLLVAFFLVPMNQVLVLGAFHFPMLRVAIMIGWIRLGMMKLSGKRAICAGGLNKIDKVMIYLSALTALDAVLLWREMGAFINGLGLLYSVLGGYFLLRGLIQDEEDIDVMIRTFAVISVVIAIIMVIEIRTETSPYMYLGGNNQALREHIMERDGRYRALASFAHPILAGTFGAILFPLFLGLWLKGKSKATAVVGMVASTIIMFSSASSTPTLAYFGSILVFCLWPIRTKMRKLRWGIVAGLAGLQMVMKAPIWALIARVDIIGGSSGYHRYQLVDSFIWHFFDWWLIGAKDTAGWGVETYDLANQYVAVGATSGLVPFALLIALITVGFTFVGVAREGLEENKKQALFAWALGAALFANALAFFGISYTDQTSVVWYALLVMISVQVTPFLRKAQTATDLRETEPVGSTAMTSLRPAARVRGQNLRNHQGQVRPRLGKKSCRNLAVQR